MFWSLRDNIQSLYGGLLSTKNYYKVLKHIVCLLAIQEAVIV